MKLIPRIDSVLTRRREEGWKIFGKKPSQTSLARALGVRKQQVSLWARGGAMPRSETIFHMAHLLGVRPDELYEFIPPTEKEQLEIIKEFDKKEKEDILRRKENKIRELREKGYSDEVIQEQIRMMGLTKYDHYTEKPQRNRT
ncbi:helix-turn-helix domain-containing protein [Thermoactinomyces mirandus]|uniref:Helix-turn-helix domain-containing protein n=1 Tax=Thermoactinomyces mirandus TaxID=2756294 RepID=A0A7W2ASL1_9BACL|nr:helix-turn-helix transcriptional regulator [Thermoactinomyces mirandus]MBA4602586.1 helix-turn-helix domain-containing protein [Thermoactinomyces mirandus]